MSQVFGRDMPRLHVCPGARTGTGPIPLKIRDEGEKGRAHAEEKGENQACAERDHTVQDNEGVKMAQRRRDRTTV